MGLPMIQVYCVDSVLVASSVIKTELQVIDSRVCTKNHSILHSDKGIKF